MSWERLSPLTPGQRLLRRVLLALLALLWSVCVRAEWGAHVPGADRPVYRGASGPEVCVKYSETAWNAGVWPGNATRVYFKWNGDDKCEPYTDAAYTSALGSGWVQVFDCVALANMCSPPTNTASSGSYFGPSGATPPTPPASGSSSAAATGWASPAYVLQALFWVALVFMFFHGYGVGDKRV